jgi:predicted dehydrogenase
MAQSDQINRREFMQRSTLGTAAASVASHHAHAAASEPGTPVPASDRITVGLIAVGARVHQLIEAIKVLPNAEIVSICDAYKGRIERALERTGRRPKVAKDYREILADKSVDTVVIGTPDHWHAKMAIEAVQAGKDVYIEKPLTYAVSEGNAIIDAVKKSGRILQVGSQGMASRVQQKAREIIASGRLGQITMVRAHFNRNTASGAWIYPIPPDASAQTVDWEMFLGSAPKRPVDYARFFRWRCYQDYSGGMATDLFVHLVTSIHYMMNAKMPAHAVALGQLYRWKGSRDVDDTINAILEYPEGFCASLSGTFNSQGSGESGFQILGTKGSLMVGETLAFSPEVVNEDNRWIVESWPSATEKAYYDDPKVRAEEIPSSRVPEVIQAGEHYRELGEEPTIPHMRGFLECVKTRRQPIEDALAGHRAAAVPHIINLSAREKRLVSWDFSRENVKA